MFIIPFPEGIRDCIDIARFHGIYYIRSDIFAVDAWGRRRNPTNWTYAGVTLPMLISRGYTGHEHMDEFKLINMIGRVYDPITSRFLSPDIEVQDPSSTQSYNRYSYCFNNPMKYSDPSGYKAYMDIEIEIVTIYGSHNEPIGWRPYNSHGGSSYGGSNMFGRGMTFSVPTGINEKFSNEVANRIWNSEYGGTWSESVGTHEFSDWDEGMIYGIAYVEVTNGWAHTEHKNPKNAIVQYMIEKEKYITSDLLACTGCSNLGVPTIGGVLGIFPTWEAFKIMWNMKIIGASIPDNISVDLNVGSVFGRGASITFSVNFLTRGDVGIYLTRTEQWRFGAEIDWGINFNFGYYTGNTFDINKATLLGPVRSVSGGWMYGGNGSFGYLDDSYGTPSWITVGGGFGLTVGGSYGYGQTFGSWNKYYKYEDD